MNKLDGLKSTKRTGQKKLQETPADSCSDYRIAMYCLARDRLYHQLVDLDLDLKQPVYTICGDADCLQPSHLRIGPAGGVNVASRSKPFADTEDCRRVDIRGPNGDFVDLRRYMLALFKVAREHKRFPLPEDIEVGGRLVASCGNPYCIDTDHVRIVFDDERDE